MRPLIFLFTIGLLLPAAAMSEGCVPSSSDPEVDTNPLGIPLLPRYYYDDGCQIDSICGWYYEETNGIDGLQRRDEMTDDTCGGAIEGDTIFF